MTILQAPSGNFRLRLSRSLPVLVLALLLLGATNAFALTCGTVLNRAQTWVDRPIPYSQVRYHDGYRTDCSGFASMVWGLRSSYTTRSLQYVTHRISVSSLKPGDGMLCYDNHVRIFRGWVDATHKEYIAYEQTGGGTKSSVKNMSADLAPQSNGHRYYPVRLDTITDGPAPWNLAANPTFDVWAQWGKPPHLSYSPAWWQTDYRPWATWARKMAVVRTGRFALGLINPSTLPADVVGVWQTRPVKAGRPYTVYLYASTDADPEGLEMGMQFLDASGTVLTAARTTGDEWGIRSTSLRKMSLTATAPSGAISAMIGMRLAGAIDASGPVRTSAVIDDVRLYDSSPLTSEFTVSTTSLGRGHSVTLNGRVDAPGKVRVYVTRPGSTKPVATTPVSLVAGAWSRKSTLTLRGTYVFTATYLGYGPFRSVTSSRTSVTVR